MNPTVDFQIILNHFRSTPTFVRLVNSIRINPDTTLYLLDTSQGNYFLYETDEILDRKAILIEIKRYIGEDPEFIEVINPASTFEEIPASSFYKGGRYRYDFESVRKYINDKDNSATFMVSYLIKCTHIE